MSDSLQQFRVLHQQSAPLLIGNVWNVQSARISEASGFTAIATSSAAVAETLGYQDGEGMTFGEYLFIIRRIADCVSLPLSVDLEAGYGVSPQSVASNISQLIKAGVVAINIEDSVVRNGTRSILPAKEFAGKISAVRKLLADQRLDIFINLRSDVYLLGMQQPLREALERMKLYANAGIDGIFFPCITQLEDIRALCAASTLPLNVMCMPGLPDFAQLQQAGVKRISMGNFLNKRIYEYFGSELKKIKENGNFQTLF